MQLFRFPHPVLRYKTQPVRVIDQSLRNTIAEMFEKMYEWEGVGLAANQIGLPYQLFVMNELGQKPDDSTEHEFAFINPVIVKRRGRLEGEEGCLSFPDIRTKVFRAEEIEFQAIIPTGELKTFRWKGFKARIVQHELDHLRGQNFIEKSVFSSQLKVQEDLQILCNNYDSYCKTNGIPTGNEYTAHLEKFGLE